MNHRSLSVLLLISILGISAEDLELQLLHNNDMHGRFAEVSQSCGSCKLEAGQCYGGFARVAHLVREARKRYADGKGPPVIFLNAGDTFTGTSWFSVHKSRIAADFLNRLQPDCISLGNHEFDYGAIELNPFLEQLQVPIVASNVDLSTEPKYRRRLKKSHILKVKDTQIGVIGYLLPDTKMLASTENVTITDEVQAIRQESEQLEAQGVKIIIALGHSGFEMDKTIARECPLVDVVVGGHTNTFLYNGKPPDIEVPEGPYPVVVKQDTGKEVPVVQAYAYTKYLGRLNLTFNSEGQLTNFEGQPILVKPSIPQDEELLNVLKMYEPEVLAATKEKIGYSKVTMNIDRCRYEECNFGNLIADAMVEYATANYAGNYWTDCAIGLMNGGGIRSSIEPGDVLNGDILGALPFEQYLYTFNLKGSDLKETLEVAIRSNGETSRGEFLQVSGLKIVYDVSKPVGQRVVDVKVRCAQCKLPVYEPLNDEQIYKMFANNFILRGGDGFGVLTEKAFKKTYQDVTESSLTIDYIHSRKFVYPEISGRITFVNDKQQKASAAYKIESNILYLFSAIFIALYHI